MELLVKEVGLTPLEAITAATRNGAQVLGVSDSYGTIAPGKMADLVVLTADPSADIRNTTKIAFVIKGGVVHKRKSVEGKSDNNPAAERELRQLVRTWDEANVKADVAALDRLLADEFAFVNGPNKPQYLASLTLRPSDLVIESAVSENVEVQVYGDTAVVVGLNITKGRSRGQPFENKAHYMDVWIKRSNRWQCVKVYSNLIEKK
jgi:ketosteroid isomerase-like protein